MMTTRLPAFRRSLVVLAFAAVVSLAGCSTTGGGPVQVTRFHMAQPIAPGSVWVIAQPMEGPGSPVAPDSLELQTYGDTVGAELGRLGFTRAADAGTAEYSVSALMDRATRADPRPHGAAVSFGIGGASFGRRSGFGGDVGTTVPIGGNNQRFLVGTRMMVQIKRRSEGTVIWDGRGMTEAPGQSPDASPQAAVAKLARAFFTGFPGESGRTITVK